jgi:hypothetical protein
MYAISTIKLLVVYVFTNGIFCAIFGRCYPELSVH